MIVALSLSVPHADLREKSRLFSLLVIQQLVESSERILWPHSHQLRANLTFTSCFSIDGNGYVLAWPGVWFINTAYAQNKSRKRRTLLPTQKMLDIYKSRLDGRNLDPWDRELAMKMVRWKPNCRNCWIFFGSCRFRFCRYVHFQHGSHALLYKWDPRAADLA